MTRVVPLPQLSAGLVQHPVAHRQDQPAALGNRDEHIRRQQTQLRVLPTQQRFGADDALLGAIELGLVMQHQLTALHRLAQVLQQAQLAIGIDLHRRGEERIAVPAKLLGVVHGHVGMRHQLALVAGIVGIQRDAEAGTHLQLGGVDQERLCGRFHDPLGDHQCIVRAVHRQCHDELIAAQPRERILRPQQGTDAARHRREQAITQLMTIGIVDGLEAIQVAEDHRHRAAFLLRALDRLFHAVLQQHAVGQLGQRVVQCGLHQLLVGIGQRVGQHPGALTHAAVEQRSNQRDAQRRHRRDDDQHRQPLRVDAAATHRAAHAAFGETRGRHAGVMHADDGQPHQQRGEPAHVARPALLVAQAEGNPQRGARGGDGQGDGSDEPAGVIVDARLHAQCRHAQVMHGRNRQAHQHRAGQQLPARQAGPRHQPQRIGRRAYRHRQRPKRDGQVVAQRNR
ncbi:hypothetical protein D3C71_811920 [compost metagenome]